jgi:hypothetical protein
MYKIDQGLVAKVNQYIAEGKDFSISPKLPVALPANGYMVSMPNVRPLTSSVVDVFRAAIAVDGYVGGWMGENGIYCLDASIHVDDLNWALSLGKFWKQDSIYDCRNECCIKCI